jgi:hypothetical protein
VYVGRLSAFAVFIGGVPFSSPPGNIMRLSRPRRKFLHAAAGAAVGSGFAHFASASDYPTRPVHLIIG